MGHLGATLAVSVVLTLMVEIPMTRLWKIILDVLDLGDRGTVKKRVEADTELATIPATTSPTSPEATDLISKPDQADSTLASEA